MSTVEFISGKVIDTVTCNFLEKNYTAIVCENLHIYFKQKWNKLPLPLGRSQENVHDGIHFRNSYRHRCWQLFKNELHYSQLEGRFQKLWNKINKKLCLPSVRFKENVCAKKFIFAEVIEYFLQPFKIRTPQ